MRSIQQLIQSELVVEHNGYPFTMYLGPNEALLAMNLQFHSGLSATEIESTIRRLERGIQARHPAICHLFLQAARWQDASYLKQVS